MTEWLHFLSFYSSFWRKKWQPTLVFLPGKSHGQTGLVGCRLWGCSFPGGSEVKSSAWNAGDSGSISESGRPPGEGNGSPLQYSCLENPIGEEPGGLQSMGSQTVGHDWATSLTHSLKQLTHTQSIVNVQCCVSFRCTAKSVSYSNAYIHSFSNPFLT